MAAYRFKAVDAAGAAQSGMIEAASPAAARAALRGRGLLPLELTASVVPLRPAKAAAGAPPPPPRSGPRLPLAALTLVTRQMATLLGSGLRIEDALSTIAAGQPPKVAGVLLTVRAAVLEGRSFGDALAAYPQVFSDFYRATVRAGEQSGTLDQVMTHLAAFVENRARNRQTVQLALLYPALLAVVSLSIITLLMAFVVPDIVRVFASRGADLPFITRALIAVSAGVRGYGLYAGLGLAVAILGFGRWVQIPANRLRWDGFLARARLTRKLVQRMNAAQFAGTLATLVQSRVPLVEALMAAADVTPNRHIRAKVAEVTEKVRQGSSLKRALDEAAVFPPMLTAMVASGEATGNLGAALDHAATDQQRDLDAWVRALVALVEPAILLVMGGLVMLMVLAILLPIVSLNGLAGV
ncbi:type II secretion system F family protein [Fertoebacter nigrum]|uniref:Type II secretion system F family protein n=1 Tax=Fertoeibacter niger TaxID=2656921 RepID=A0A8X8KMA7_9RHOB|nr:type II secretion system F family protein [Fertoeibacter niger]NUB42765.1 type II secretion system F family protein [Fertoeibacter niger]